MPRFSQDDYIQRVVMARQALAKKLADPKIADLLKKAKSLNPSQNAPEHERWSLDHPLVKAAGRALMKAQNEVLQEFLKTNPPGIGTWLGFNFYDLRGPAYFLFPLLTPFIQMIPKKGKVNAGVGTAAHWKATRNPNSTYIYAGVSEGQRNAIATPNEIDYLATYKELGMEGGNTFTSQWAGEGYTDNLADEHFRNLARLRLQEEMMTLLGNSGTASGNLGFALGQANNVSPSIASSDTFNSPATAGVASANCAVAVVAITGMGMNPGGQAGYGAPPTVGVGLVPTSTRTNVDGTTLTVAGGTSAISNVSSVVATNSTYKWVNVTTTAIAGAVGYAWYWYIGTNSAVLSNVSQLTLGAITSCPKYTIGTTPSGPQLGNAAGLGTDNSYQPTDFDGLLTYAFKYGLWTDMNNGSFTPIGNGQVQELETDLAYIWNNFQCQPDAIWVAADVRTKLDQAVIYSSTGTNSYIFQVQQAQQATGLTGGFIITGYKSKYSINAEGGTVIPIRLHPMLPAGTMYYDLNTNPYQHSRIPAVREFFTMRDYYAIEWPVVTREWTYGTYIHEVLAHYLPWISAVRTSIGPFVAPCWIAAIVFNESFISGPRVNKVRNYLLSWEQKSGLGTIVVGAYRTWGKQVAAKTEKSKVLRSFFTRVFNYALKKAEKASVPVQ